MKKIILPLITVLIFSCTKETVESEQVVELNLFIGNDHLN